jgi:hypothetical protein
MLFLLFQARHQMKAKLKMNSNLRAANKRFHKELQKLAASILMHQQVFNHLKPLQSCLCSL